MMDSTIFIIRDVPVNIKKKPAKKIPRCIKNSRGIPIYIYNPIPYPAPMPITAASRMILMG